MSTKCTAKFTFITHWRTLQPVRPASEPTALRTQRNWRKEKQRNTFGHKKTHKSPHENNGLGRRSYLRGSLYAEPQYTAKLRHGRWRDTRGFPAATAEDRWQTAATETSWASSLGRSVTSRAWTLPEHSHVNSSCLPREAKNTMATLICSVPRIVEIVIIIFNHLVYDSSFSDSHKCE